MLAAWERGGMVSCAVLKVREEAIVRRPGPRRECEVGPERTPGLSKLNSMPPRAIPKDELEAPGPVDVPRSRSAGRAARYARRPEERAPNRCSLERR